MPDNKDKAAGLKQANTAAQNSPTAAQTPGSAVAPCVNDKPPPQSKVLKAYFAQRIVKESGKGKAKTSTVSFPEITNAVIGYKVYLVVETSDLPGGDISAQILGSNTTTFVKPDEAATFMSEGTALSTFKAKVGNYTSKTAYKNAADFKDKAIIELELKGADDQKTKDWIKSIGDSTEKKAFVHLSITAAGGNDTLYNCEDDTLTSPNKEKSVFYNKKDAWFEIYGCLCGKKLIAFDLQILGISNANATKFLDAINTTIDNYTINTCIRLSHFLAQARHESGDFVYLKEIWGPSDAQAGYEGRDDLGNNQTGDGQKFMGRGLIQITGRKNYTSYGTDKGEDFTTGTNNERLEQVTYAVDSAGWYWSAHLDVDLNTYADNDDAIYCTYRINGGFNGYRDRETKTRTALRAIGNCRNTDLSTKGTYTLEASACYTKSDAVYKWANLLYGEGTDASTYYQRYLDQTEAKTYSKATLSRRQTATSRIKKK